MGPSENVIVTRVIVSLELYLRDIRRPDRRGNGKQSSRVLGVGQQCRVLELATPRDQTADERVLCIIQAREKDRDRGSITRLSFVWFCQDLQERLVLRRVLRRQGRVVDVNVLEPPVDTIRANRCLRKRQVRVVHEQLLVLASAHKPPCL